MKLVDCAIVSPIEELGVEKPGIVRLPADLVEQWLKKNANDHRLVICRDFPPSGPPRHRIQINR